MAEKPLLLVVDDDPLISDALGYAFANDFDIVTSHARTHCLRLLQQLRQVLPPAVALWVGGQGVQRLAGIDGVVLLTTFASANTALNEWRLTHA